MKNSILIQMSSHELREVIRECLQDWKPEQEQLNMPDERLSQTEAAKFLGITAPTIIEWRKKGKLPFHRVQNTRKIFYLKSELIKASSNL